MLALMGRSPLPSGKKDLGWGRGEGASAPSPSRLVGVALLVGDAVGRLDPATRVNAEVQLDPALDPAARTRHVAQGWRSLAAWARWLSPLNSRMMLRWTSRSTAAIAVIGFLKILSHSEKTRLEVMMTDFCRS